jgi:hypothetical protein
MASLAVLEAYIATGEDLPTMPARCSMALWYDLSARMCSLFLKWLFPSSLYSAASLKLL